MAKAIFKNVLISFAAIVTFSCGSKNVSNQAEKVAALSDYKEQHRLQFHFSPDSMWMNDPNGMVYLDGEYHLFYQYYPDSNVWGPMHWGHAISKDLVFWQHMPVALYPDVNGYIFSGSAVADLKNTSGFGSAEQPPLVAIFTYHDPVGEKEGKNDFQTQGIAYSLDKGRSWTKYENNPVLMNPGIRDFRDPKVFWHEETSQWVMILAVKDRVHLYSSPNLKEWTMVSEFGETAGAHGGVWECPDLFTLDIDGETKWVMLVSINPGGPNGGSATQYFIGEFDGRTFIPNNADIRWIDYGPDNYAGVLWSNVEDRRLFIGWMSNWDYATRVPTERWRSAMTVPRTLKLVTIEDQHYVASEPAEEVNNNTNVLSVLSVKPKITVEKSYEFKDPGAAIPGFFDLQFTAEDKPFEIKLSNSLGEYLLCGYDAGARQFYIDRTNAGKEDFSDKFASRNTAPRILRTDTVSFRILVDVGSVELFADDGTVVMTALFFPNEDYSKVEVITPETIGLSALQMKYLKSIW